MAVRGMRIPGHWTAWLTRRIGLDRNPLRRGTDRAEAWLRITLVLAFLIGAPLACWGAGHWAGSVAPTAARAQQAGEHRVPATLLRGAPSGSDSFTELNLSWVKARWVVPRGPVRTGYVQAPVGSHAVRDAIENVQPVLALCGHIHESRGTASLGRTLVVNPGSTYPEGVLQGSVITLDKAKVKSHRFVAG